jgi:KaiC/GvpD/RAD55 family RecA-like ATPase
MATERRSHSVATTQELFEDFFGEETSVSGSQLKSRCPLCGKPNFYLNGETRAWCCHHKNTCGAEGYGLERLAEEANLADDYRTFKRERMASVLKHSGVRHPPKVVAPAAPSPVGRPATHDAILKATAEHCHSSLSGKPMRYLKARKLGAGALKSLGVGVVPEDLDDQLVRVRGFRGEDCVAVGVLRKLPTGGYAPNWEGALLFPEWRREAVRTLTYRLDEATAPKGDRYRALRGHRRGLINADAAAGASVVYIAEGFFDTGTLVEFGLPTVGLPSATTVPAELATLLTAAKTIYVCLDNDEAGRKGREKLAKLFADKRVVDVYLPHDDNDINDFAVRGGTKEEFEGLVTSAEETSRAKRLLELGYVPMKSLWPEFEKTVAARKEREFIGLKTGFEKMDKQLSGLRGLVVLGGPAGVGKTTLAYQVGTNILVNNSCLLVIISLEMSTQEVMKKIAARLAERPFRELALGKIHGSASWDALKAEFDKIIDRVFLRTRRDNIDLEKLPSDLKRLKAEMGVEDAFVILDSLQYATILANSAGARTEKQCIDQAMTSLEELCDGDAATAVLVISHTTKAEFQKTTLTAYSGSSMIAFGPNVALMLEDPAERIAKSKGAAKARPATTPPCRVLHILKDRFGTKAAIPLLFDGKVGKFAEDDRSRRLVRDARGAASGES